MNILMNFTAATLAIISSFACYNNQPTIDQMKDYLCERGVPQLYIDNVADDIVLKQYSDYKNNFIKDCGTETSHLYIGDTMQSEPLSGVIKESDMTLNLTKAIEFADATSNKIQKIKFWIRYDYLNMPVVQKQDAVICNWDPSVFTYLSNSFDSYSLVNVTRYNKFNLIEHNYASPNELVQGGLGYTVNLSGKFGWTTCQMMGIAFFELIPKQNPTYESNGNGNYFATAINTQYRHNGNPFVGNVGLTSNGVSISFNLDTLTYTTSKATNVLYCY